MSRRRRAAIIAVCVGLGIVLVWLDRECLYRRRKHPGGSEEQSRTLDLRKYHGRAFTVVNVVDGDTLDIDIPDGEYEHTRVRLWGLDTPETKSPKTGRMYFGEEAAEFARQSALNKNVWVYLDEDNRTRGYYGRLLAYIQLPDKRFLNELLLAEGYAYADLRFRHGHYNRYKQLESAARGQKKGLWEKVTREQLPEWLQKERPELLLDN
ncbi:MAG: thermonuclease family protein [Sedimentisphaerales bacterium]|nr:thermonuclease family protein [Sedimentisphaerales bacterium]